MRSCTPSSSRLRGADLSEPAIRAGTTYLLGAGRMGEKRPAVKGPRLTVRALSATVAQRTQREAWCERSASTWAAPSPTSCCTTRRPARSPSRRSRRCPPIPPRASSRRASIQLPRRAGVAAGRRGLRRARHHRGHQRAPRAARARAPRSSRRAAFATCSRSPGRSGPRSTTCSREKPVPLVPRHLPLRGGRARAGGRHVRIPLDLAEVEAVLADIEAPSDGRAGRGAGDLLPLRLPRSRARAAGAGARPQRLPVPSRSWRPHEVHAGVPRVRAAQHHRGQRLPRPAHERATCSAFRARVEALGIRAAPVHQPVERRDMSVDGGGASCRCARPAVRAQRRRAGAAWIASQAGFDAIVTFDMGGTSTDVAFVRGRRARARVRARDRRRHAAHARCSTSTPSAPAAAVHRLARLRRRAQGRPAERGRRIPGRPATGAAGRRRP